MEFLRLEGRPACILGVARRSVRGGLKLEIAGIEVGFCTPVPRNGGGGFRAQARIPPGQVLCSWFVGLSGVFFWMTSTNIGVNLLHIASEMELT